MLKEALNIAYSYIYGHYEEKCVNTLAKELMYIGRLTESKFEITERYKNYTYEEVQGVLSKLNEKENIRKKNGVYYTPADVVDFILINTIKSCFGKLKDNNISDISLSNIPKNAFATKTTVFDPTCGSGEFLLRAFELKVKSYSFNTHLVSNKKIKEILATIYGNDINEESIGITKVRLLLCAIQLFKASNCTGLAAVMENTFTAVDFISRQPSLNRTFDIIVGNPPYVEDSKAGLELDVRYGNIYANVLKHSSELLNKNGSIGFIIPLSYVATPRMKKIRDDLFVNIPEQFILNYADRPDCLFDSVHQKLSILIGKQKSSNIKIYTSAYQYWYKSERENLFSKSSVVKNTFLTDSCIPKLGSDIDVSIYKKIIYGDNVQSVYEVSRIGNESVYLNRREAFWMKAYRTVVNNPEYKVFSYDSAALADYCYCLINSSLFWWYWICTSDCWHVSKELNGFKAPKECDLSIVSQLANALAQKLEETKVYVGTKQTEYEYKHRLCVKEIHEIDGYINSIFGLTEEESEYIKQFAFRYRVSGGSETDGNN